MKSYVEDHQFGVVLVPLYAKQKCVGLHMMTLYAENEVGELLVGALLLTLYAMEHAEVRVETVLVAVTLMK